MTVSSDSSSNKDLRSLASKAGVCVAMLERFYRRWGNVYYKALQLDMESKLERGQELMDRWEKQPNSLELRMETARYIFDSFEFIGIINEKLAVYRGEEETTQPPSFGDALDFYFVFSDFCTYYNPYIFKSHLKIKLANLRTQLFRISTRLLAGDDSQALKQEKEKFVEELVWLLLPDLLEHLLKSCDAAKLRDDIDGLSDYLYAYWV